MPLLNIAISFSSLISGREILHIGLLLNWQFTLKSRKATPLLNPPGKVANSRRLTASPKRRQGIVTGQTPLPEVVWLVPFNTKRGSKAQ